MGTAALCASVRLLRIQRAVGAIKTRQLSCFSWILVSFQDQSADASRKLMSPVSARADTQLRPCESCPTGNAGGGGARQRPPLRPTEGSAAGQCGHWPLRREWAEGILSLRGKGTRRPGGRRVGGHFSSAGVSGWASALCVSGWASPLWAASLACSSSSRTR